ncbi:MAG: hypothetical protein GY795_00760 [Desulfobacterales bacterium]|nr:hypothetical protein [Desulfobacterales bacterium]
MLRRMLNYIKLLLIIPDIKDCLVRQIDPKRIEDAFELEHQEFYNEAGNSSGLSPYFMENEWKPFIAELLPGDELWFYRLPTEYWQHLQGHQGYVIIRNGRKIAEVRTKWN